MSIGLSVLKIYQDYVTDVMMARQTSKRKAILAIVSQVKFRGLFMTKSEIHEVRWNQWSEKRV